ncbi:MAG TPA: nucleoside triphosphate pyrophosphohydrolase [Gemmatimonadaceae bacterium]
MDSAAAGSAFQRLVDVMARLRAPDGCPWDREQTYRSLRSYVLEETYEVLDAIDREDYDDLEGELGDFVFEAVFLAQIAADEGRFTIADSLEHIVRKLIRRHPHVFGEHKTMTPARVLEQWEQIKATEQASRGEQKTVLGGVARALPALLRAYEIGNRVAAVGFDWVRPEDVVDKVREEVDELAHALGHESKARAEEEMGDLLFAIANLARKMGIEPESALRQANEKFTARFEQVERRLEARGRSVHEASLEEMENEWAAVKTEAD